MDPKNFDDILKEKLKGINSNNTSMPDWSRMEREIDEDSVKDQMFDEQVKRKLDQVKVNAFSKTNWSKLYELINTRIQRKKAVFISKAFELSILALLFLTAGNLGLLNQEDQNVQYAQISNSELQATSLLKEEVIPSTIIASATPIGKTSEIQNITRTSARNENFTAADETVNTVIKSNAQIANNNFQIAKAVQQHRNLLDTKNLLQAYKGDLDKASFASLPSEGKLLASPIIEPIKEVESSGIEGLELDISSIDLSYNSSVLAEAPLLTPINNAKGKWFITAGARANNNSVKSGFRESIARTRAGGSNINVDETITTVGYGLESNIGYSTRVADFSTGLEFNQVSYNPSIVLKTGSLSTDILETNIQEITYDIVSIPLNIDWNIFKIKSWKAQINTGFVTSFLTKTQQLINQNLVSARGVEMIAEENIDLSPLNYNFNRGIFDEPSNIETKSLSRSIFLRAKLGVGIEKKLTPGVSIFGNFQYLHQLPTSSSNSVLDLNDRINSVSFGIGVKKHLG